MRRFRNPRYAPEALERKLHPSGFGLPITAEFAPASTFKIVTTEVPDLSESSLQAPVVIASRSAVSFSNDPPQTPEPQPTPNPREPLGLPPCPDDPDQPA